MPRPITEDMVKWKLVLYIDEATQCLQSTDMRRIANEILKKLNCRLIKSTKLFAHLESHEISVQGKPRNIEVDGHGHLPDQRRNFLLGTSTCTITEHL